MTKIYIHGLGLATALLLCGGCGSHLSPSNSLYLPPPCSNTALFRVNCGAVLYKDSCGNNWAADQAYTPGAWGYFTVGTVGGPGVTGIANTPSAPLFYKERYGTPLEYRFDVPAGTYNVTLYFSESYWTSTGKRSFSVVVEGVTFAASMDLFALAGKNSAYVLTGPVPVLDGTLNIVMTATLDNALIDAIEVK
jgi:hypothetical protein